VSRTEPDLFGREARAAFREFVRTHHPDRGGDPVAFRAGLEFYGRAIAPKRRVASASITVHHRRRGLGVFVDAAVLRWRRHRRPPRVH